jgi:hypothetical protein
VLQELDGVLATAFEIHITQTIGVKFNSTMACRYP